MDEKQPEGSTIKFAVAEGVAAGLTHAAALAHLFVTPNIAAQTKQGFEFLLQ
jgi:hypothetical protein